MKIFILCGGFGTRLDNEGKIRAKPLVQIGNEPILIHIIRNFCDQGFNEFVLCLGYNSESIIDYFLKNKKNKIKIILRKKNYISFEFIAKNLKFKGHLIFTGINTGTGGRILLAYKALKIDEDFFMTYGDGLANVNIKKLIKFHYKKKSLVTLTAVRPKQRYGVIKLFRDKVNYFDNSKKNSDVYINGGFFVISKDSIKIIKNKTIYWEKEPLNYYIQKKKLFAFKHNGFWKSLDTLKDKKEFNELHKLRKKPWKIKLN